MSLSSWIEYLRNRLGRKPVHLHKAPRRPLTIRLRLEALEDRTLPSASSGLLLPAAMPSSPPGNNLPALSSQVKQAASSRLQISNVSVTPSSFSPNGDGVKDTSTLSYTLSAEASVTINVLNSSGKVVASLQTSVTESAGSHSLVWYGKNSSGAVVPDGSYHFSITATPSSGAAVKASASVTVDAVPPSLTINSVAQINITNQKSASLSGATVAGATVTVQVSDGTMTTSAYNAVVGPTGKWSVSGLDLSGLADGTLTYTVTATDAAGNSKVKTATGQKSTLTITTVTNPVNLADEKSASAAGTAQASASITVQVKDGQGDITASYSTKATTNGSWTVSGMDLGGLADGTLTYTVTASIGSSSTVKTAAAVKDTVPPALVITSAPDVNLANQTSISISGTTEAGTIVTVQAADSNNNVVSATADNNQGAWSVVLDLHSLADGPITYTVTATDAAGNSTVKTANSIKDTVLPALSITTYTNPINTADEYNLAASGTTEPGAAVTIQLSDSQGGKTSAYSAVVDSHGNWLVYGISASGLADGAITYTVTATDAVGNSTVQKANAAKGTQAPPLTVTSYTNPINLAVKGVVSASGKTGSGDTVTVQVSDGTHSVSGGPVTADGNGNWTISGIAVGSLNDGNIVYTITATDANGNSTVKTVDTVMDTATPPVSIASVTTTINAANQTNTTASGTSGAGDTVSLYVVDGSNPQNQSKTYTTTADSSGTWSISGIDVSGLADGTLTYTATATDAYGNVSTTAATMPASKDTVAAALTIGTFTDPVNKANASSVSISGNADAGDSVTLQMSDSKGVQTTVQTTTADSQTGDWSFTTDASGLADGTLTYTVTATGSDGNPTTKTATAVKDTVAPALTIGNAPNVNAANRNNVSVSGTTEIGASVTVQVADSNNATVSATAVVDSHGNWSVTGLNLSALADGSLTYTVTATDAAGNSTIQTASATKATGAPTLTLTAYTNPINFASNNLVSASGRTGNDDKITVQVSDGTHSVSANTTADGSGVWSVSSVNVQTLLDGPITYTVTATDAAGNSTSKSVDVVKDTVTPMVQITDLNNPITAANQTSTSASGTSGANDTVTLYVVDGYDDQTNTYTTTANGSGQWSLSGIDVSGLFDGQITYTATATNADGNVSSPATMTTLKDTVPVSLTISSAPNVNVASQGIATVSGTSDAGDSITVEVSDGVHAVSGRVDPMNNSSGQWQVSVNVGTLADGTLTYTVGAVKPDGSLTTKTATALKITQPPVLTVTNAPNVSLANQTNVSVSGTTEAGAAVTVQVTDKNNQAVSANAVVDSHGNWSVSGLNLGTLADGAITYTVTATDAAGNSSSLSPTATKTTQAPTLTITSYTNPINLAANNQVSASGRTGVGDSVTVQVSDGTTTLSDNATVDGSGTWLMANLDVHTLQDGPITYTVTATDAYGNSTSKSVDAVKDTFAPTVQITSATTTINDANETNTSASGTASGGATVTLYVVDGPYGNGNQSKTYTTTASSGNVWSISGIDVSGLADGPLTYMATATDVYGNTGTAILMGEVKDTVPATLTISSVSNVNGTSGGSATVSGTSDAGDGITVQVSDGTNTVSSMLLPANNTGSWQINVNVGSLADGTLTYTVTTAKADGNSTTKTATALKETVAPALSITNDTNPINAANDTSVVVSGTTEPGAAVIVQASDGTNTTSTYTATVDSHGNWSVYGLNVSALDDGTITYTATATDAVGNSTTTTANASKDTEAPALSITSIPTWINLANQSAVSIGGKTDAFATVAVHLSDSNGDKTPVYSAKADSTGTWSINNIDASGLVDGTIIYTVTATSTDGNTTTMTQTDIKDTVAPTVTSINVPSVINIASNGYAYVSGTTDDPTAGVTVYASDNQGNSSSLYTLYTGSTSWSYYVYVGNLADGTITFTAYATDPAGNTSPSVQQTTPKDTVAPTVTITSAPNVDAAGGYVVSASGTVSDSEAAISSVTLVVTDSLSHQTTTYTATVNGTNWSVSGVDLSNLADGDLTYHMTATNVDGNTTVKTATAIKNNVITTVASGLYDPFGVAVDAAGDMFIADTDAYSILRVDHTTGNITTVISGLDYPYGVAVDTNGDTLYVANTYAGTILQVTVSNGSSKTIASGLSTPEGVAVDGAGDVFIADTYAGSILRVDHTTGNITTVISGLDYPYGVAVDSAGDTVYVANTDAGTILQVTVSNGSSKTIASGLDYPNGVAVDAAGDVFIADTDAQVILRWDHTTGNITTVAGNGSEGDSGDGGGATSAEIYYPSSVAVDAAGDIYIVMPNYDLIRKVTYV